ncbi:MAG: S8 family serine peptidase [Candidatus Hodarchaeales archaeon]|jgi:hypothetical protein
MELKGMGDYHLTKKQLKRILLLLAAIPVPLLLFTAIFVSNINYPAIIEYNNPYLWDIGNNWEFSIEVYKFKMETNSVANPSNTNVPAMPTEVIIPDNVYENQLIFAISLWTDREPHVDNQVSIDEWSLQNADILVEDTDFDKIRFGAQNTDKELFLLFIFGWLQREQNDTIIETKLAFNELGVSHLDKLVVRFYLEKKKSDTSLKTDIQLNMLGKIVSSGNYDDDNDNENTLADVPNHITISSIKRVDKNSNRIHDILENYIYNDTQLDPERYLVPDPNTDEILVIVLVPKNKTNAAVNQFKILGGKIRSIHEISIEGFFGWITAHKIPSFLNKVPEVLYIGPQGYNKLHSDVQNRITMIRNYVWDTLGYNGTPDARIAILDTGIDSTHPMLQGQVVGWYDVFGEELSAVDHGGHGSHVASIIAGLPYNGSDPNDENNIRSTWSYLFVNTAYHQSGQKYVSDPQNGTLTAATIQVQDIGWINASFHWLDRPTDNVKASGSHGWGLRLVHPNGTIVASDIDTSATRNFSISYFASSSDLGDYKVFVSLYMAPSSLEKVQSQWEWTAYAQLAMSVPITYPYNTSLDGKARFIGVAPDAKLVGVKGFHNNGLGSIPAEFIDACDWIIANKEIHNISITSMSLGWSDTYPEVDNTIANLIASGILPVISAGNAGQGAGNQIFSPNHDGAILVAASGDYDQITSYSSEGPGEGNVTKPDITAHGGVSNQGAILMVDSNTADADASVDTYGMEDIQANDMTPMQGTSMSCPQVSGIANLVIDALGGYSWYNQSTSTWMKVKQLILMSAHEIYGTPDRGGKDNVEGYGRVNADAAIEAAIYSYTTGTTETAYLSSDYYEKKAWIHEVSLVTGQAYSFTCNVPDGVDYDLYLYLPDPDTNGEPLIAYKSINPALGGSESFTYTATTTGDYYIAVKYISGSGSGNFTLNSDVGGINYPTVTLVNPASDSSKSGDLTIQVSASAVNPAIVNSVWVMWAADAWVDITSGYNGGNGHYEKMINTSQLIDGEYTFFAKCIDSSGKTTYFDSNDISISNDAAVEKVLLVDDAGSNAIFYQTALQSLGISYDDWNRASDGSPSASIMTLYSAVIWFTGSGISGTLDISTDQVNIKNYLDNNAGNVFLTGAGIAYDVDYYTSSANYDATFLDTYFHAQNDQWKTDPSTASGMSGTIFEEVTYSLTGGDGANNADEPDKINGYNGGVTAMYYDSTSTDNCAVTYSGGNDKIVFLSFPWEAINSENDRKDAIRKVLSFLGVTINTPPTVNITSPSSSIIQGSFILQWTATDDQGMSYYHIFLDGVSQGTQTSTSKIFSISTEIEHTIRVIAVDTAGKKSVDIYTFTVDNTAPSSSINPVSGSSVETGTVITIIATDSGSDISYINYRITDGASMVYVDWQTVTGSSTSFTLENYGLGTGDYNIEYYAIDNTGNTESTNTAVYNSVTLDEIANLEITIISVLFLPLTITHTIKLKKRKFNSNLDSINEFQS